MTIGPDAGSERLVKSVERVRDHGEVFTPAWLVESMLDLVKDESERIDSRFLEPACGSGNFLIPVLRRELATVQARYAKSSFERRHPTDAAGPAERRRRLELLVQLTAAGAIAQ